MKTIKEIITDATIKNKLFFKPKNEKQFKKIFRILKCLGFKYHNSGADLSDSYIYKNVSSKHGAFSISNDGISIGTEESCIRHGYHEKDIFNLFNELNIEIKSVEKDFCLSELNCLSSIKTKNGANARIIATDFKRGLTPLVVALSFDDSPEQLLLASNDGSFAYIVGCCAGENYTLVLESETIELKQVRMTVSEIEKALGIYNLKIVE